MNKLSRNDNQINNSNGRRTTTNAASSAHTAMYANNSVGGRKVVALENRRTNINYKVKKVQYLENRHKKDTSNDSPFSAAEKTAAENSEKQGIQQQRNTYTHKNSPVGNSSQSANNSAVKEAAKKNTQVKGYVEKAAEVEEKIKQTVEVIKTVETAHIPEPVNLEKVIDNSVKKDSVFEQGKTAAERAKLYAEKAKFYSRKKSGVSGKDVGKLYKKAYRYAHKEEILNTVKPSDISGNLSALKHEIDNINSKDNIGEAATAAAMIPAVMVGKEILKHTAGSGVHNTVEMIGRISSAASSADSVGEAAINTVTAVPKYVVEKQAQQVVNQIINDRHDRQIAAKREALRNKQEKVEKRAQELKKEQIMRKMKTDLYKSEHGIASSGNGFLKNAQAVLKNTLEGMKKAISAIKSSSALLMAAGGSVLTVFLFVIIVIIVIIFVLYPFLYISEKEIHRDEFGNISEEIIIEESSFKDTIQHYYKVLDKLIDDYNESTIFAMLNTASDYNNSGIVDPTKYADYAKKKALYDEFMADPDAYYNNHFKNPESPDYMSPVVFPTEPPKDYYYSEEELSENGVERGPIFEGFVWSEKTDGTVVPKGVLYDEMLCTLSTYNAKVMNSPGSDIVFMTDDGVAGFYGSQGFWEFTNWEESVDCPSGGNCCSKMVTKTVYDDDGKPVGTTKEAESYCPGHYVIVLKLKLDFDLDKVWENCGFDDKDEKIYKTTKKQYDKDKKS